VRAAKPLPLGEAALLEALPDLAKLEEVAS
jgi:hypothetical protein